jgi:viologen exporter family transport system permease protein
MLVAQIRSQASYRTSFAIDTIGGTLVTFMDLLAVLVLFRVTKQLAGFAFHAALLMAAIAGLAFASADILVGTIEGLRAYIRNGRLDSVLVRPLGVLGQLAVTDFQIRRIGRIVQGIVVLVIALRLAHVEPTGPDLALVALSWLGGTAFFAAVFVIGGTIAFWWIDSGEFANGFTYGGRDFTTYPMTIYGSFFRRVFAQGLGFAFVAYYPALALLHQPDPLGLPAWTGWMSPLVAALAAAVAALVWRVGVRQYRSTGS